MTRALVRYQRWTKVSQPKGIIQLLQPHPCFNLILPSFAEQLKLEFKLESKLESKWHMKPLIEGATRTPSQHNLVPFSSCLDLIVKPLKQNKCIMRNLAFLTCIVLGCMTMHSRAQSGSFTPKKLVCGSLGHTIGRWISFPVQISLIVFLFRFPRLFDPLGVGWEVKIDSSQAESDVPGHL